MGLLKQAHPFSQQAGKAASHTDSRRIYLAASSADTRLSGPSAGLSTMFTKEHTVFFFYLTTAAPNVSVTHSI